MAGRLKPHDEPFADPVADWFPTLAGLAGYKPNTDLKWDGSDQLAGVDGHDEAGTTCPLLARPERQELALRKGDQVLIRQKGKPDELYDLAADPCRRTTSRRSARKWSANWANT